LPAQKRKRPRGVVDTSVLIAGIAGLKSLDIPLKNPSANLLRAWIERDTFVWLVSDEILLEYKRVLARLGVRRPLIGKVINLLREEAELVSVTVLPSISPDPGDDRLVKLRRKGGMSIVNEEAIGVVARNGFAKLL
jgi:predicted nucleic acid-binding protein